MRAQTTPLSPPKTATRSDARTPKGVVRKASTLHMTYPGLQPLLRTPTPPRDLRADLLQKYTFRSASPPDQTKRKALGSCRNADDLAAEAAKKSSAVRDALFALRRLGKNEEALDDLSSPPGASIPAGKAGKAVLKALKAGKKLTVATSPEGRTDTGEGNVTTLPASTPTAEQTQQSQDGNVENAEIALSADSSRTGSKAETADIALAAEKESSMLVATLNGLRDSATELRETGRMLRDLQDPVTESGGARHPTAIIAQRNLSVVQRKAELLEAVEVRLAALESKCSQKEELFKQVTINAETSFEGMCGVRQFISQYTHKPEDNPADADKSSFDIFVTTFGIHKKHMLFERMMDHANTTALWWAGETLTLAQDGAESDEIKRHMDVVSSIGADKAVLAQADEKLKACTELLGVRLAEQCLRTALKLQEKDKNCVERSRDAQPQSAKDCAAAINDDIRRAVALGASVKHPAMLETKQIVMTLESEEKVRYGLEVLLEAKKIQKKESDAAMAYEKKEGVPPVGPASDAADAVEKKIKDAIKKGAPESHEHIKEAGDLAKELRDTDGIRKRTANRAKRSPGS